MARGARSLRILKTNVILKILTTGAFFQDILL